ncbi:MAG TPA: hypothetical protein VGK73_31440 [Polyangiaceae bacterium]
MTRLLPTLRAFLRRPLYPPTLVDGYTLPWGARNVRVADIENVPGEVVFYRVRRVTWWESVRARVEAAKSAWSAK